MNMILLTIISPCRIPQSIQKMVKRAGEIPAGQRRWALGQRICAHCLVYRYIYSKFWGCDFQGQGALHRKNSRKGPFAASEWTKLKSLLARRVPSSCKPAKGHSNLTLSTTARVTAPMNSVSGQCLWTVRPGRLATITQATQFSKLLGFPISNTFMLDNWDLGVSWNNQCSFEIHSFFLPRKGRIHSCSWCGLLGDWEWFISTVKWSVLQDMKYCCATRKPLLFILLHFIEFF